MQDGTAFCTVCGAPVQGQQPAPQPNQYGYYQQTTPPNSDSSTASMICGIIGILLFWIGLINLPLSIVALVFASKDKKNNGGVYSSHGKAGFITGLISLILGIIFSILFIFFVFVLGGIFVSIVSEGYGGNFNFDLFAVIGI